MRSGNQGKIARVQLVELVIVFDISKGCLSLPHCLYCQPAFHLCRMLDWVSTVVDFVLSREEGIRSSYKLCSEPSVMCTVQFLHCLMIHVANYENHGIIELFQLEGSFKCYLVQLACTEQVAVQSLIHAVYECSYYFVHHTKFLASGISFEESVFPPVE